MRDNQQEANKLLLESWLNEVLDSGPRNGVNRTMTTKGSMAATKHGLSSYGGWRDDLSGTILSPILLRCSAHMSESSASQLQPSCMMATQGPTAPHSAGLSRAELASLGLVGDQIDRLYRSLYVYTVGFHDSLRSMFKHCKNPTKLLADVWKGYISVADAAIQVLWHMKA